MKTNKTKTMSQALKQYWDNLPDDEKKLKWRGPRGGTNAAHIPGWCHSPSQTVTKACLLAGIPVANYWTGSAPTPSSAIPAVLYTKVIELTQEQKLCTTR